MRIPITHQARREILAGTRRGALTGLELGGSLMSHEIGDEILVAYSFPTGPAADRGPGHVRTDAAFQNAAIARVQRRCPKLAYAGDWHVHPMFMPRLSGLDERTARGILEDEGARRDRIVILLGTQPPKGGPIIVGYVARLRAWGELDVRPAELVVVADDSEEVRSHLGHPLLPLDELLADADPEPAAIPHEAGARIASDLEEIVAELGAEAHVRLGDGLLGAVVRRGAQEALVLFPPEYPLGAPQVFAGSLAGGPLRPVELRYAWSSRHRLVDVVTDALAPGLAARAVAIARTIAAHAPRRAHLAALGRRLSP